MPRTGARCNRTVARSALVLAALALTAVCSASASAPKVSLARGEQPRAGEPWTAALRARPGLRIVLAARNGTTTLTGRADRRYRVRLTFPYAGRWTLEARVVGSRVRLGSVVVAHPAPVASVLPGATATRVCAAGGEPVPQYALAFDGASLWVACRTQSRLQRVSPASGQVGAILSLRFAAPYAIAAGGGSVWAAERGPRILRVDARTGRSSTAANVGDSAYVFFAAGSAWAADDAASRLLRIDAGTRRTTAELATGKGTSALASDGRRAWIVNHRDGTLERIDLATNRLERLARLPGDAPERMVLAHGSLWVAGRGTDLLRVDPETGAVLATVEIGAGAIDLQVSSTSIWVAGPSESDDRRGWPGLERLLRVDPATNRIVDTIQPTATVTVGGMTSANGVAWLLDPLAGRLYRLP